MNPFALLQDLAARLDRRARRFLIFASASGMGFAAASTAEAVRGGSAAETALSAAVLALFTLVSTVAWTGIAAQKSR